MGKQLILIIDAREIGDLGVFVVGTGDDTGLPSTARLFTDRAEAMEWYRGSLFDGKCMFCLMGADDFEWEL